MTTTFVVELGRESIMTALWVIGPIMMVGFAVGMTISLIQAIMQIQEMTLAFVPKLFAIGIALIVFGHWMLGQLIRYTTDVFASVEKVLG